MKTITELQSDFKSFERILFKAMCQIACDLMREYLEQRDKSIMALRDTKEYRYIEKRATVIKTLMGEVSFSRVYYKKKSGGYAFLLDEAMGINSGYGLVSENLAEEIVHECADKSFRKAARSIGRLTGQSISAMGAWNIVQQYGSAIEGQETRLAELSDSGCSGHLGNISSQVLFEEYDDVWIPRQRERRRKAGTAAKGGKKIGKKPGKLPMHIGIAYTGWTQSKDGRYNTEDKISYASFGKVSEFTSKFDTLLDQRFDMDGIRQRVTNGDGEAWIRKKAEENDSVLQLDPFHRSQAVIKAVGDKIDRQLIFDAIAKKDVEQTLSVICELALDAEEETAQTKLSKLYHYFYSNRDSLLTWQQRGIDLPPPPEGISYRDMGVAESSNCVITQRMKHRRGSWSAEGGNNMARILCFRSTIGLDAILGYLPEAEPIEVAVPPLSAAQSPKHDGKGYGADWLYASMPFEQAFKTHGREVVRNILRMKPVSGLSFI
jgi:hypothetical protein